MVSMARMGLESCSHPRRPYEEHDSATATLTKSTESKQPDLLQPTADIIMNAKRRVCPLRALNAELRRAIKSTEPVLRNSGVKTSERRQDSEMVMVPEVKLRLALRHWPRIFCYQWLAGLDPCNVRYQRWP